MAGVAAVAARNLGQAAVDALRRLARRRQPGAARSGRRGRACGLERVRNPAKRGVALGADGDGASGGDQARPARSAAHLPDPCAALAQAGGGAAVARVVTAGASHHADVAGVGAAAGGVVQGNQRRAQVLVPSIIHFSMFYASADASNTRGSELLFIESLLTFWQAVAGPRRSSPRSTACS